MGEDADLQGPPDEWLDHVEDPGSTITRSQAALAASQAVSDAAEWLCLDAATEQLIMNHVARQLSLISERQFNEKTAGFPHHYVHKFFPLPPKNWKEDVDTPERKKLRQEWLDARKRK